MPKPSRSNPKSESDFKPARLRRRWIWAGACALACAYLLLAMADYRPNQSSLHSTRPSDQNAAGKVGVTLAEYLYISLGGMAWIALAFVGWLAYAILRRDRRPKWLIALSMAAALASGASLLAIQHTLFADPAIYQAGPGGAVGHLLYASFLEEYLGNVGSAIILFALLFASLAYLFTPNASASLEALGSRLAAWRESRSVAREARREAKRLAKQAAREERRRQKEEEREARLLVKQGREAAKRGGRPRPAAEEEDEAAAAPKPAAKGRAAPAKETGGGAEEPPEKPKRSFAEALKIVAPEETKKARFKRPESHGDYTFPKLDLLSLPAKPHAGNSEEEHARNAQQLRRTLKEFGVEVTLGEVHIGPVITRYEVYPAPGVRVERIANLDKNIALGMRAQSVRILAPVPGKGCVGVEVPNQNPTPVGIREILESADWAGADAEIPIALGRDVSGKPLISDLTRMPHLLIAGATGSGKTVCINSIIASLLYHSSPERLRFIMVDPKIVEMKIYNDLPHMLIPVVTDPKKVPGALKWLIHEMERRYELFSKFGVRNISGFNNRPRPPKEKKKEPAAEETRDELDIGVPRDPGVLEEEVPDTLPFIVCIVDELADLMMVAPADVETGIARLAQLARAAGIHLILATQRPSVNVITGVIKANLPCRIAFQVASKIDSRTILDGSGAEQLIGRGDMLFAPPGTSKLIRSQGAFVSDDEIRDIVDFLKGNGPPDFAEDVQRQIDAPDEIGLDDDEGGDTDDLLPQAMEVIRSTKRASTSMLQRRLRIGYNRAARIMELLEERGVVGPENGSSPREILVDLDAG